MSLHRSFASANVCRRSSAPVAAIGWCLLPLALLWCMPVAYAAEGLDEVQRELPEFTLKDTDDETWSADSLEGKPWIINFWATWCPPCIEEMPSMNSAWQKLEDQGVGMLAINAGEGLPAVEEFLDKIAIDFPVLLGDGASSLPNWSVMALPTTVVVNADGQVVYQALGPREWDDDTLLQQVLDLR